MSNSMDRLKETQAAHRDLNHVSQSLNDLSRRLAGVYMDQLADEVFELSCVVRDCSKTIERNASLDVSEELAASQRHVGEVLKAFLDRPDITQ